MTVGAELLLGAVRSEERGKTERFRARFFPSEFSYAFVSQRLKPRQLDKIQRIDQLAADSFHQAMSERGIQNFRVERDADDFVNYGLTSFDYILRFQEGPQDDLWTEDLGFKAVIINYNLGLNKFSANIPLVVPENTTWSEFQLQEALRMARNSGAGKLIEAEVYFEIHHSNSVLSNLRKLLNLALVHPTRIPPKF